MWWWVVGRQRQGRISGPAFSRGLVFSNTGLLQVPESLLGMLSCARVARHLQPRLCGELWKHVLQMRLLFVCKHLTTVLYYISNCCIFNQISIVLNTTCYELHRINPIWYELHRINPIGYAQIRINSTWYRNKGDKIHKWKPRYMLHAACASKMTCEIHNACIMNQETGWDSIWKRQAFRQWLAIWYELNKIDPICYEPIKYK